MADMSGQDPSEIKMATVDEEQKGATFSGTVILAIDSEEGGEVVFLARNMRMAKLKLLMI